MMSSQIEGLTSRRGKACLNCRSRKMRCDAEKPTCGPCNRREDACEYTKPRALEEYIALLENRIRDLEKPTELSSSVFLAYPSASQPQSQLPTLSDPNPDLHQEIRKSVTELPPLPDCWWDLEEPPVQLRKILLDNFLPYNVAAGFFLNLPRFINSYLLYASEDNCRPSQALLSTVYLWGIKVSHSEQLTAHESVFLARAIRNISSALASDHPQKGKHAVQAEILITHYLFCNGRYLEGRYHSNAAVSIAISFGFHRIRSTQGPLSSTATVDPIEEGEMINAFWTTYMTEQCWSTALNVPSTLLDTGANGRIDSPWPLDPVQYEKGLLTQDVHGYNTVQVFLENPAASSSEWSSITAASKASALLHQASVLAKKWEKNGESTEVNFESINQGMNAFYETIPRLPSSSDFNIHTLRKLILIRTITLVAIIHFNTAFVHQEPCAISKRVEAASTAIHLLDNVDLVQLGFLPLIMGHLWLLCGRVLIHEITRLRGLQVSSADSASIFSQMDACNKALDRLEAIMLSMITIIPIFGLQRNILAKAREEQAA